MSAIRRRPPTSYRQAFKQWEQGIGQKFVRHIPNEPNYVKVEDAKPKFLRPNEPEPLTPFPRNSAFISEPVLSEELKEAVWEAVVRKGLSVRRASVDYQIDIRRVAAVVRLKEIEKQWVAEGKKLAKPYTKAIMEMLPQTPLTNPPTEHETINDVGVHRSTLPQVFWPVAESQHFTRREAGNAFETGLLPAEDRIPHPQLYAIAKARMSGIHPIEASSQEWEAIADADLAAYNKQQKRVQDREKRTTTVQSPRWAFKFESVLVDKASVGKFTDGIGTRYGMAHEDRKKSQVKIPTKVDG